MEDLGSRNGCRINGNPLKELTELADGDRIRIGTQELVFSEVREQSQVHHHRKTGSLCYCGACNAAYPQEMDRVPALRILRARREPGELQTISTTKHAAIAPRTRPHLRCTSALLTSRRGEHQLGDLGRAEQAHGRPPVAGAAADVDLRAIVMSMQARDVGLVQRAPERQKARFARRGCAPRAEGPRRLRAASTIWLG